MELDPGIHIGMHLVFLGKTGVTHIHLPRVLPLVGCGLKHQQLAR
jgi:hypothetical protein